MKKSFLVLLSFFCLNAFAGPIEDAVKEIEVERNAICTRKSQSTFKKCFGQPMTCLYNVKFTCVSNEGNFELKVKVIEDYRGILTVRGTVITE